MEWDPAPPAVRLISILDLPLRDTHSSRGLSKFAFRFPHRRLGTHSPWGPILRSVRSQARPRTPSTLPRIERIEGKPVAHSGTNRFPPLLDPARSLNVDPEAIDPSWNSLAWLGYHVDERRVPTFDHCNGTLNRWSEIFRISNRSLGVHTHALRQFCEIDVRIGDRGTDIRASHAAIVPVGHTLEMHHFLMVRPVIVHDIENRDAVMRRRPQNPWGIHEIAIALNVD